MGTGSRAPFLPGHVLVRGARVSRPRVAGRAVAAACAAGAGGSVTRRRAERAEPEGRGGAESSAEQPLPAAAADPGPGPRPGSMDRSSLLQLIQEQQLDPENTGFIGADTFTGLVHRHELPLDPAKLDMLVALAQSNERGQVCYQELADLVSVLRAGSGVGLNLARAAPGLEWDGQVAPPPCPAHRGVCGHGAEPGTR